MKHAAVIFALLTAPAWATEAPKPAALVGPTQVQAQMLTGRNTNVNANRNRNIATGGAANVTVNGAARGAGSSGRGAPDVFLGGVNGGNPCGLGAGVGGSGPGAGGLLTWMWEGDGCESRQTSALLNNLGLTPAAIERLCFDDKTRRSMYTAGTPCAIDRNGWRKEWWQF